MKIIKLRPGKERSLNRRHPWVYDSAIAKGGGDTGETVRVESDTGAFLAWGAYSPTSKIRVRTWSFDEAQRIDAAYLHSMVESAVKARQYFAINSNGQRLIHGESDGLPGLIVDRYDDILVAQFLSAGTERWKADLLKSLIAVTGCQRVYERSDSGVRQLEGLPSVKGWLAGSDLAGGSTLVTIQEHDWRLALDVELGHKTGFYLDQRDSRKRFADYCKQLQFRDVLNCYCYTGGFSVAALAGGAGHVTSIDSSAPAIEQARANIAMNGFDAARTTLMDADVNASLRNFHKEGRTFDAIVLDPPKFAPTAAHAERAARAYKDINRLAFKILRPGGMLFTYSCSGGINADLFHKIIASAGMEAAIDGYIVERLGAAPDHPMTINFPEGEYLKGLAVMRKR